MKKFFVVILAVAVLMLASGCNFQSPAQRRAIQQQSQQQQTQQAIHAQFSTGSKSIVFNANISEKDARIACEEACNEGYHLVSVTHNAGGLPMYLFFEKQEKRTDILN